MVVSHIRPFKLSDSINEAESFPVNQALRSWFLSARPPQSRFPALIQPLLSQAHFSFSQPTPWHQRLCLNYTWLVGHITKIQRTVVGRPSPKPLLLRSIGENFDFAFIRNSCFLASRLSLAFIFFYSSPFFLSDKTCKSFQGCVFSLWRSQSYSQWHKTDTRTYPMTEIPDGRTERNDDSSVEGLALRLICRTPMHAHTDIRASMHSSSHWHMVDFRSNSTYIGHSLHLLKGVTLDWNTMNTLKWLQKCAYQ